MSYKEVLLKHFPGKSWSMDAKCKDFKSLVFHDGTKKPTKKRLDELLKLHLLEKASKEFQELRKLEYPSIDELTVALWELLVENSDEACVRLQAIRKEVKDKYPKPEAE